ncbi:VWA domain-containing protein [Sphingomonas sp. Leaf20]|uniref:VWA domain-containing protein n=1 Tax=Sphingomonas sp. Leaf20 TaxID=1735685 RepID=UPI0006F60638|nr:VWA domain-containing protein [Sphingomonas sp. Leaf20]KQM71710.1 hypothetical protein ASE72_09310 [Sphingomonas sp. Leaf20]
MALQNVDAISIPAYTKTRDDLIKVVENAPLATGAVSRVSIEVDGGGNLFIGYGFDLDVNSENTILTTFASAGIVLNDAQKQALKTYKATGSEATFKSAWSGVTVNDAEATVLLSVTVQPYEDSLTAKLGGDDLGPSKERAALISQTYNLGKNAIPTEIGLLQQDPTDVVSASIQRASIYYEVAFDSTSLSNAAANLRGLEARRLKEAHLFDLYSSDNKPATSENGDEAKAIFSFLDSKDKNNALETYLTARKFSTADAKNEVDATYAPAIKYLSDNFGQGLNFSDRHAVIVDSASDEAIAAIPASRTALSNLIFGEGGADTVNAGAGRDVVYGGEGNDILNGGEANDVLIGGAGDDTLDGGQGLDTAVYKGNAIDYKIVHNKDDTYTISHVRGAKTEGSDTLRSVENAKFDDQGFALAVNSVTTQTDFALVIDTTGSMSPYINQVKSKMAEIVDSLLASESVDAQISIVGFKDPGETTTILNFTSQDDLAARKAAAITAINSVGVSGGGDFPEGDNSGLLHALKGSAGLFRDTAVKRDIAIFTDADVKDTYLASEVARYAADVGVAIRSMGTARTAAGSVTEITFAAAKGEPTPAPVRIFSILVGPNGDFLDTRENVADLAQNGGRFFDTDSLDDLTAALFEIIETPANRVPVISSNGGGDNATASVVEGGIAVTVVNAVDPDTGAIVSYAIDGGADAGRFVLDPVTGALAFVTAPDFEVAGDANGDNVYEVIVSASDGLTADVQALAITVTDVEEAGGGRTVLNGTAGPDQYRLPENASNNALVAQFGRNDSLVLDTALADSNRDGIITFGRNGALDLEGPDAGGGTVELAGIDGRDGLRSLGSRGGEFFYADATVRPKGAVEGSVGNDLLRGTSKADEFFFDTALGLGLGPDKIINFGVGDRIVTTSAIYDANGDNLIGFGGDRLLDLPDADGGAGGGGGTLAVFGTSGRTITQLAFVNSIVDGDVTYYYYGLSNEASIPDLTA